MTTYTDIPNGDTDPESPITTSLVTLLRDNPIAMFEKAAGAPVLANNYIVSSMVGNGQITYAKCSFSNNIAQGDISAGAIHQGELDTSLQQSSASVGVLSETNISFTGGTYTLGWGIAGSSSGDTLVVKSNSAGTYTAGIRVENTGGGGAITYYLQARYVNASPPYSLGDHFFYIILDNNGDPIGYDISSTPPWIYNGPSKVTADRYGEDGKQYITVEDLPPGLENPPPDGSSDQAWLGYYKSLSEFRKTPAYIEKELTPKMKDKDQDHIPHPWKGNVGGNIVLLNPDSPVVEDLANLRMNGFGENVGESIIKRGLINIGTEHIERGGPTGLMIVDATWTNTGA